MASLKSPWLPSAEQCLDRETFFLLFVKKADSSCKLIWFKGLPGAQCLGPPSHKSLVRFSEGFFLVCLCGRVDSLQSVVSPLETPDFSGKRCTLALPWLWALGGQGAALLPGQILSFMASFGAQFSLPPFCLTVLSSYFSLCRLPFFLPLLFVCSISLSISLPLPPLPPPLPSPSPPPSLTVPHRLSLVLVLTAGCWDWVRHRKKHEERC